MARDYAKEYRDYHSKPEQIKRRASRNKARRLMIKRYGKKALDGKEVDHKNFNANNNSRSNLQILPKSENRKKQPKRS